MFGSPLQVASEGLPSSAFGQVPPVEQAVFLGGAFLIMAVGTLYFLSQATQARGNPEAQEYFFVTILISATATAAYLAMLLGFGDAAVNVGGELKRIYWARYADWLFTTPLLLIDLSLLAGYDLTDPPVAALISADGIMIVAGVVGAFTPVFVFRLVWWAVSTLAFVFVVYLLYRALTKGAMAFEDESRQSTFLTLRNLTIVLWTAYPVVWLVGTEGVGVVPLAAETAAYAVLDVLAKVGFGLILLRSRAVLGAGATAPSPGPTPGASPAAAGGGGGGAVTTASGTGEAEPETESESESEDADPDSVSEADAEPMEEPLPEGEPPAEFADGAVDYEALVTELTVPEVREAVEERSLDAERVMEAERRNDARVTLLEWLDRRVGLETFTAGERSNARYEVYEDQAGEFRWRLRHRNGHIVADSGEGYDSRRNVRDAVKRLREHAAAGEQATFEVYEDQAGQWRWRLVHENGNILGDSGQGYASKQGASRGVDSVKRNAPGADLVRL